MESSRAKSGASKLTKGDKSKFGLRTPEEIGHTTQAEKQKATGTETAAALPRELEEQWKEAQQERADKLTEQEVQWHH